MVDFKAMYAMLWDFIYKILAIFGIEKDENGNLVETEVEEA
jgi:hypothetical protein